MRSGELTTPGIVAPVLPVLHFLFCTSCCCLVVLVGRMCAATSPSPGLHLKVGHMVPFGTATRSRALPVQVLTGPGVRVRVRARDLIGAVQGSMQLYGMRPVVFQSALRLPTCPLLQGPLHQQEPLRRPGRGTGTDPVPPALTQPAVWDRMIPPSVR